MTNSLDYMTAIRPVFRKTFLHIAVLLLVSQSANATLFALPNEGDSLIDNNQGKPRYVKAKHEDTLIDIAVEHLLGQEEVVRANKKVDRWLPGEGKEVLIPSSYVLPDAPRQGIVINLPEYRLYYYPPVPANQPRKVISYSVGIGRVDWKTPLGLTTVVGKVKNPTWTPPASIKEEHRLNGDILPDVWPAGPDNPLGLFAFRLGIPGYLLHSTNKPQGVGMQVSHGCMRLYPKDIEQFFPLVNVGTQVNIINQPVKVGWSNGSLYIESHPSLEGEEISFEQRLTLALGLIEKALTQHLVTINSEALKVALDASNGLPTLISTNEPPVDVFATPAATPNPALPDPPLPALDLTLPADAVPVPEVPVLPAPVVVKPTPAVVKPTPVVVKPTPVVKPAKPAPIRPAAPKKVVPKSAIDAELQHEEQQERVFKTSPFPH